MHVIFIRLQRQQREAVRHATSGNRFFGRLLHFARQDTSPILWNPYKVIGDLIVRPTGFTGL